MVIENTTDYRNEHLEAIIRRVLASELDESQLPEEICFLIDFRPPLRPICGQSEYRGSIAVLLLERYGSEDRVRFAHTVAHECAHLRGLTDADMEGDPRYDEEAAGWRDLYSWADQMPLERRILDPQADAFLIRVIQRFDEDNPLPPP